MPQEKNYENLEMQKVKNFLLESVVIHIVKFPHQLLVPSSLTSSSIFIGNLTKEEFNKMKQELEAEYLATFKKTVAMHETFVCRYQSNSMTTCITPVSVTD